MHFEHFFVNGMHILIWLHTETDPPPADFDKACVAIQELKRRNPGMLNNVRQIVITDGGTPNSRQRAQLNAGALDSVAVKTAAITTTLNNPIKRRIAQAILWTQPTFKAYAPNQWRDALKYLDIDSPEVFEQASQLQQGLAHPLNTLAAIRADIQAQH
jgi:hypothetical protein